MTIRGNVSEGLDAGALGSAIDQAMGQTPLEESSPVFDEAVNDKAVSDLDNLGEWDNEDPIDNEPSSEDEINVSEEPASDDNVPELELKVKGYKEAQKIKLDPNDDNLKSTLNKGLRFEKVMAETAAKRKELESRLAKMEDYEKHSATAKRVETAQSLLEGGYKHEALQEILGDSAQDLIEQLVQEEVDYRSASPEDQLKMDADRERRQSTLAEKRAQDRIKQLEEKLNGRAEEIRESEYQGHFDTAKSKYDLNQWIDDPAEASSLNEMLHTTAMNDVIKLQRKRELAGEPDVTQRDIRRAYAQRAKQIVNHTKRSSSEMADKQVAQQTEAATESAKVASTKNYKPSKSVSEFNGSMADLVDAFRKGSGII